MSVDFYWITEHYIPEDRTLPLGYGQNWKNLRILSHLDLMGILYNLNTVI
jgi:hypothetical protein